MSTGIGTWLPLRRKDGSGRKGTRGPFWPSLTWRDGVGAAEASGRVTPSFLSDWYRGHDVPNNLHYPTAVLASAPCLSVFSNFVVSFCFLLLLSISSARLQAAMEPSVCVYPPQTQFWECSECWEGGRK